MIGVLAAGAAADAPEPGGSGSGSGQRQGEEEATGGPAAGFELTAHGSDAAETHDLAGVVLLSCADEACNAFDNNQSPNAASG